MEQAVYSFSQYGMKSGRALTRLPWTAGVLFDLSGRLRSLGIDRFQLLKDPTEENQGRVQFDVDGDAIIFLGKSVDPIATIDHEAIHILRKRNLFTESEWDALTEEAGRIWIKRYDISERYPDLPWDSMVEEAVAEAYADYKKRVEGRQRATLPRLITRAFSKISAVFSAAKRTLLGHGVRTSEDLFRKVSLGEVGSRQVVAPLVALQEAAQRHENIERDLSPVLRRAQDQPGFWEWSKGNKIPPMVLYHGTTQEFSSFDPSRTHPECAFGRGFYFTDTLSDVQRNYATPEGPDLKNKIEHLCERLADRIELETGVETDPRSPEIEEEIMESLISHEGAVIPVFVRMTNPIILGGENETFFEPDEYKVDLYMDEAREELEMSNYSEDPVEDHEVYELAREKAWESGDIIHGGVSRFIDSLENISDKYCGLREVVNDFLRPCAGGRCSSRMSYYVELVDEYLRDGCKFNELISLLSSELMIDIHELDPENDLHIGMHVGGDILRHALEDMGYDGIIDHTVSKKFANMDGMNSDTTHYIVFDPKNIKSVFNQGSFSLDTDNISYQAQP